MTAVNQFFILNLMLVLASGGIAYILPYDFPRCCLGDPQLSQCLLEASVAVKPFLRNGIKEIGVPGLNPVIYPKLFAVQKSNVLDYAANFENYTIWGLDDYNIKEIGYDPTSFTLRGTADIKLLTATCLYDLRGRLHVVPVEGKGNANATFGPLNGTFEIQGKLVNHDGVEYYSATATKVTMTLADWKVWYGGLFGGDEERGRITNEQINMHSKIIAPELGPALCKLLEDALMNFVNPLMKAVPYKELFPCVNIENP